MDSEIPLLRRDVLELSGSMAAVSGCLSDPERQRRGPNEMADDRDDLVDVDAVDGSVVKTAHLLTDSRNADVVVWKDDSGTVHADGKNQVIASGDDFSTVVQTAVDEGASKIVVQDGHYVANDPILLDSGTIVTGVGTDTTVEVAGNAGFRVEGEKTGSAALTEDVGTDDSTLSVSDTTPFEADELLLVNTDRRTDYRNQRYGEIRRITGVDDRNGEITLTAGGMLDEYRTENNAKAVALDDASNVTIRDMELVGQNQEAQRFGIVAKLAQRVMTRNVVMRHFGHSGVMYLSTIYSAVDNCKIHDVAYEYDEIGYGVMLADAVRNVRVRNCVFHDMKNHCTAVSGSGHDGFPRLITFESNEYYEDDADIHYGGVIQFKNNRFANGHGGILTGAETTYVSDCEFRNLDGPGIQDRGDPEEVVVVNSQFKNVDGMAINLYENPRGLKKLTLAGNDFTDIRANVLRFRIPDGTTCNFVGVTENVVNGCGSNAFNVTEMGDATVEETNFVGNHVENVSGFGISTSGLSGPVRFIGNSMSSVDGSYAFIAGGSNLLVANNDFLDYADRGVLVRDPGLVAGNTFNEGGNDAVRVYQTEDVYVTHNKFEATAGADVDETGSTDCKFVWNDLNTSVDSEGESNVVAHNFGYTTEDTGTYSTSATGGDTFEIPHDLAERAEIADIWAESADAAGAFYVSGKSDGAVTVTYRDAPPAGSGNLTWGYEVKTHPT